MPKLKTGMLETIGKELVTSNPEMFNNEFSDGMSRGLSKADMVKMITGTFQSAAEMELDYGTGIIQDAGGNEAYSLMAAFGYDFYANGDMCREDAKALVNGNWDSFKTATGSQNRRVQGSGGAKVPPKKSQNLPPRDAKGRYKKKPKKSANSKGNVRVYFTHKGKVFYLETPDDDRLDVWGLLVEYDKAHRTAFSDHLDSGDILDVVSGGPYPYGKSAVPVSTWGDVVSMTGGRA